MLTTRVIPCLLLKLDGLVKTKEFKEAKYVGDPINAIRIFNQKEVDELILLDILATVAQKGPPLKLISEIASECFMPLCYGGGIRGIDDIRQILSLGVEKVAVNTYAVENPYFIRSVADTIGSQSLVVAIDVKKNSLWKYEVFIHGGSRSTGLDPVEFAVKVAEMGAGEILLNSIDRDGTMRGYDIELVKRVSEAVSIPVIACGGAGKFSDFADVVKLAGASAVAAGSLFVFSGKHRAVLISYPSAEELRDVLK